MLFEPIEARHITHWAIAECDEKATIEITANAVSTVRIKDLSVSFIPENSSASQPAQ